MIIDPGGSGLSVLVELLACMLLSIPQCIISEFPDTQSMIANKILMSIYGKSSGNCVVGMLSTHCVGLLKIINTYRPTSDQRSQQA